MTLCCRANASEAPSSAVTDARHSRGGNSVQLWALLAWIKAGFNGSWTRVGTTVAASTAQGEDEEGETDELVNSVLDEIGIDLNGLMVPAPGQQTAIAEQPEASVRVCCAGWVTLPPWL